LGTSLAALANAAILLSLLRVRIGGLDDRRLLATLTKISVAAVAMAAVAVAVQAAMERVAPGAALHLRALRVTISIGSALAALAAAAKALHIEEFDATASMLLARVRKLLGRKTT